MLNTQRAGRTEPEPLEPLDSGDDAYPEDGEYLDDGEGFEIHHAICPDCGQSIALVADEEYLPQHALCLTPGTPSGSPCAPAPAGPPPKPSPPSA